MNNESSDKFARITSIIALLLALAAVIVPYIQQANQFEIEQNENLNIIIKSGVNGPILLTNNRFGEMGTVVQIPWKLTISNTCNRTLSIIDKQVSLGDKPDSTYFSGIDGGLYSLNNEPVTLPIKLEPGDSQSYLIFVGCMIPQKAFDIIYKVRNGNPVMDRDAMKALGRNGIDIFGNPVEFKEYEGDNFSIKFHSSEKAPTYWISLFTGAGNRFAVSASKFQNVL